MENDTPKIIDALIQASKVPQIDFFAQLTAQLVMEGVKLIPQDLWEKVARSFPQSWYTDENETKIMETWHGFHIEDNHARSEPHETWQYQLVMDYKQRYPNSQIWVIPFDELVCMDHGDMGYCDFVCITRLFFIGTEEELRQAINKIV